MKILHVIPLLRGPVPASLSYYTSANVTTGTMVEVTVRRKKVAALVIAVEEMTKNISEIKRAAYGLKKIERVLTTATFPHALVETATRVAAWHATSLGSVLHRLLPQGVIQQLPKLMEATKKSVSERIFMTPAVLQLPYEERIAHYKSLIRQSFANKRSVTIYTPTRADAEALHRRLAKGIEGHAFLFAGAGMSKKQWESWAEAANAPQPVLIIGTLPSAIVWRQDMSWYIVEHESSPFYTAVERPVIDWRFLVATLAASTNADCLLSDSFLRIETLAKAVNDTYEEKLKMQMHQSSDASLALVDMRSLPIVRGEASVLAPESEALLRKTVSDGGHAFIYATRKGYTPLTLCRDCGTVLICDRCDAPMVLHLPRHAASDKQERRFICHRCRNVRDAKTMCANCGSWRLYAYGIGIEKIESTVATDYPDTPLFVLSSDTASTHLQATKIIKEWQASDGGILIGTVRALPYLRDARPSTTILASFDTLVTLPDVAMQERLFQLITYLRDVTEKEIVVQTRHPDQETLAYALKGDGREFFKSEDARRKLFLYPPYAIPIKITLHGKEKDVDEGLLRLKDLLAPYPVSIYPAFVSRVKGLSVAHALFSVPTAQWPDEAIVAKLRSLPPAYRVEVNPTSLL